MNRLSLRVRLAALIGLMLVVMGAALLSISYGLVRSNLSAPLPAPVSSSTVHRHPTGTGPQPGPPAKAGASPAPSNGAAAIKAAAQTALRDQTLNRLVRQYLAILAGIVLIAVALGWLLAGRLLRSLRRITAVAQRVTGRNLDERIGLEGPRDELRELADAFDGMLARLDAVFSAQRRFIADASHELRTPLAAMRTEIEVLAADPNAAAADVQATTLVLRRQFARSEALIDALLALARSEPDLLAREPVDLADIAREALDDADADARQLCIDTELVPAVVEGDRQLLTLLTANLLRNAIKYNHDHGWVTLSTHVDVGAAQLEITNSGPVIAAEEAQELTQAFRRGGRARVGDGHGLGLAIVAAVARAHAGTITIDRRTEGGLRIEIRLPLALERSDTNGHRSMDRPRAVSASRGPQSKDDQAANRRRFRRNDDPGGSP